MIANHFKSKGCDGSAVGADADTGDGQGCYNGRRTLQASALLSWITGTVLPAAGDPDVLLLGDFNSYAQENPVTTLAGGGYTDLQTALLGANAYSYLFDGQLGHLDYALSSASLTPRVTGIGAWHINADEAPLFDYNDEILDSPVRRPSRRSRTAPPSCRRASCSSRPRPTGLPTTIRCSSGCSRSPTWPSPRRTAPTR